MATYAEIKANETLTRKLHTEHQRVLNSQLDTKKVHDELKLLLDTDDSKYGAYVWNEPHTAIWLCLKNVMISVYHPTYLFSFNAKDQFLALSHKPDFVKMLNEMGFTLHRSFRDKDAKLIMQLIVGKNTILNRIRNFLFSPIPKDWLV
jgi:hypothetical protein